VITVVLGGAASGKSAVAEQLAAQLASPVTYVATWEPDPDDADMRARVEAHRRRRPAGWMTKECTSDLAQVVRSLPGTVLIDSLGTWVAAAGGAVVDPSGLCAALQARPGDSVVVSDEVGLGVHPSTEAGRRFRDALGVVNQAVAAVADRVWLVIAGCVLALDVPPAPVAPPPAVGPPPSPAPVAPPPAVAPPPSPAPVPPPAP
jgi:adenosyl cobinamide kinase/adenosyl cobinamide phosphate guanylyltransferase